MPTPPTWKPKKRKLRDAGVRSAMLYEDVASGRTLARPGWNRLTEVVESSDVITVAYCDRVGRNLQDSLKIIGELTARGVNFDLLDIGRVVGPDTGPEGKLVLHVLLVIAEYQLDSIRQRSMEGQQRAREQGKRIGRPRSMTAEQIETALAMRRDGKNWEQIHRATGTPSATVRRNVLEIDPSLVDVG